VSTGIDLNSFKRNTYYFRFRYLCKSLQLKIPRVSSRKKAAAHHAVLGGVAARPREPRNEKQLQLQVVNGTNATNVTNATARPLTIIVAAGAPGGLPEDCRAHWCCVMYRNM